MSFSILPSMQKLNETVIGWRVYLVLPFMEVNHAKVTRYSDVKIFDFILLNEVLIGYPLLN